jgi:hypothetical protein
MNIQLGYALLRDRRVSIRAKLAALGIGAAIVGKIELLQIPFESVFAVILPVVGVAGDLALDGAEASGADARTARAGRTQAAVPKAS